MEYSIDDFKKECINANIINKESSGYKAHVETLTELIKTEMCKHDYEFIEEIPHIMPIGQQGSYREVKYKCKLCGKEKSDSELGFRMPSGFYDVNVGNRKPYFRYDEIIMPNYDISPSGSIAERKIKDEGKTEEQLRLDFIFSQYTGINVSGYKI